jgi:phosphatidate cytidylyltransferase
MLRWRLLLGVLLVAAIVGLCWLDAGAALPGAWLLPVVVVATVFGTKEVLDLAAGAGMRPVPWIVHLMNLYIVLYPWLHRNCPLDPAGRSQATPDICVSLVAAVLVIFLVELCRYRQPGGNMANIAAGIFAVVYVGLMLGIAVSMRLGWGIAAIASWIIVVKMGDTGAYTVGRLIGRHKLAPLLSPGKSVEGALGAVGFACLGSWAAFRWLVPLLGAKSCTAAPWWGWIAFGLLVGTAGIVGDLAESLLKRDVGAKDSSTWLPGFGGVLDIMDSLLLSAPVAWFCWATGLVG